MTDLYDAARSGDLAAVRQLIDQRADLNALGPYGFAVLHSAAMGLNNTSNTNGIAMIKLLVNAGSDLNARSRDGRTALYLAAEFSHDLAPVKWLVDAGAKPDIEDAHGNHIVANAMNDDVQEYLSKLTGYPIPPAAIELPTVKMSAADWKAAKAHIDPVFARLEKSMVVLQDAGTTQEDGFADCSEAWQQRGGAATELRGFCFYTRQDLNRAKRTSQLTLAFWAAPDGAPKVMRAVGEQIVSAFKDAGFTVDWNGSANMRPTVLLTL